MHRNSLKIMGRLLDRYAPRSGLCIDVGSQDVNGSYRGITQGRGLQYLGIDIAPAKNVDLVLPETADPGSLARWRSAAEARSPELIISGQCLEHTRYPWEWMSHVVALGSAPARTTFIVIAPAAWPLHRYPVDCWRILPDGMQALMEWAGLEVLEVGMDDPTGRRTHLDCWGVGRLTSTRS